MEPTAVSKTALVQAIEEGLCEHHDGCTETVLDTVRLAVPFTHPKGNFRYADYVLRVEGNEVMGIGLIACQYCSDRGYVYVRDACGYCDSEGCERCQYKGSKLAKIPCQDCKKN